MKLSVIIPCYNAASTIVVQLDALGNQCWSEPWEIIVADNRSADDSRSTVNAIRIGCPICELLMPLTGRDSRMLLTRVRGRRRVMLWRFVMRPMRSEMGGWRLWVKRSLNTTSSPAALTLRSSMRPGCKEATPIRSEMDSIITSIHRFYLTPAAALESNAFSTNPSAGLMSLCHFCMTRTIAGDSSSWEYRCTSCPMQCCMSAIVTACGTSTAGRETTESITSFFTKDISRWACPVSPVEPD